MASVEVTLTMMVTLEMPDDVAGQVTRKDLVEMASAACCNQTDGIQLVVEHVAQEKDGQPVFADVFLECDPGLYPKLQFWDNSFTRAEAEPRFPAITQ